MVRWDIAIIRMRKIEWLDDGNQIVCLDMLFDIWFMIDFLFADKELIVWFISS